MNTQNSLLKTSNKQIYAIVILSLLAKFILLPFSQTVDADAVSRVHLSMRWMENPEWISTNVWGPFHFYLNGFALWLWNDIVLTPKVVNILLSSLSILPFYFFSKREFNQKGALIASIFFALSPILFRNSFMALSETPYLLFFLLCLNLISKSIRENNTTSILLAGLCITIASGFRYEAWLLMTVLGFMLLFLDWKKAFLFGGVALIFPIAWMLSNWVATGDAFFSIQGNYRWTLEIMGNNDTVDTETMIRRIWFFPFSWLISVGPPVAYISIKLIIKGLRNFKIDRLKAFWAMLFVLMIVFFIYNSFKGVLLLQHRFIGTLVVLSLPFVASYFSELSKVKLRNAWMFAVLIVGLSFFYNTNQITPLPRLGDQNKAKLSPIINENLQPESALIMDFVGWEYSYYYVLQSRLSQKDFILVQGAKNSTAPIEEAQNMIEEHRSSVLVLSKESEFAKMIKSKNKNLKLIQEGNDFDIYSYHLQKVNQ